EPHGRAVLSALLRCEGRAAAADVDGLSRRTIVQFATHADGRTGATTRPSPNTTSPDITEPDGKRDAGTHRNGCPRIARQRSRAASRSRCAGGAAVAADARALCARVSAARLAVAVGCGHHPVGRRVAIPTAALVPGARPRDRPVAVLDAQRLCRLAADQRSA